MNFWYRYAIEIGYYQLEVWLKPHFWTLIGGFLWPRQAVHSVPYHHQNTPLSPKGGEHGGGWLHAPGAPCVPMAPFHSPRGWRGSVQCLYLIFFFSSQIPCLSVWDMLHYPGGWPIQISPHLWNIGKGKGTKRSLELLLEAYRSPRGHEKMWQENKYALNSPLGAIHASAQQNQLV